MSYQAQTLGSFLRRVAIDYVRYGYVRYALREIPPEKDPTLIDCKLVALYGVTRCRVTRMRRRKQGLANVQYVRFGHSFVLLATEGHHPIFENLRTFDIRSAPLYFRGYSIGVKQGKPCVMVAPNEWSKVQHRFSQIALHQKESVEHKLNSLPYYHFPGVIRQKLTLVTAINKRRKQAGLLPLSLAFKGQRL